MKNYDKSMDLFRPVAAFFKVSVKEVAQQWQITPHLDGVIIHLEEKTGIEWKGVWK